MSEVIARQVLNRLHQCQAMIAPHHLEAVAADLRQLSAANATAEQAEFEHRKNALAQAYGFDSSRTEKPFAFAAGLAIIPVHGSLINRFGNCWGYVTGYNFIQSQFNMALADDDVKGIILDLNSYGGEVAGCFEVAEMIYEARGKKPTMGLIDSNCYSACYAIASALDRVVSIPSGGSGSVGVVAMHVSMEKWLENIGLDITFVYAGKHKVDGNPFKDLPEAVRADIQRGVDASYEKFVSTVARNRGLEAKAVKDTEARVYRADEAVSLGLIDAVDTPAKAATAFLDELSGSTNDDEDEQMDEKQKAEFAAQERTAERTRLDGIINCEEAKGRSKLANHLAFNTQLSVEDAKGMLAAAAVEEAAPAAAAPVAAPAAAPAAAAPAAAAPAAAPNAFAQAMNNDQHPNLHVDNGQQVAEQDKVGNRLLANAKAAGVNLG